ncbi:MAG: response regulator transcription factor [Bacteroidota bacterium]
MDEAIYKILVVDDEEDLCEILQFNLEGDGHEVDVAYSAEEALQKDLNNYDLFLLDVMMNNMSGFKLAEIMRRDLKIKTPIIFITAKNTENDLLTGFSLGGDDYIKKPFSIKEVLVRVKAVAKRPPVKTEPVEATEKYEFESLFIDKNLKQLIIDENEVELTRKEYEILIMLLSRTDRFVSREEMLNSIWGDDVIVSERTIDVHITRVRKKLGIYGKYLVGRSGYGYRLNFKN